MKKPLIFALLICSILIMNLTLTARVVQINESTPSPEISIPVIVNTDAIPSWQAVITGIQEAAKDYGVEVLIKVPQYAPPTGIEEQVEFLKDAIASSPPAIILSALDPRAFTPYFEQARDANIPIIGLDSNVVSPIVRTLVTPEHYGMGELAAHKMAQLVDEKGKVAIIDYLEPIKSSIDKREGFINTMNENYPDIEILRIPYSEESLSSFQNADDLKELIKTFIISNPDIQGIFASISIEGEALINAIKDLDKAGEIKLIGTATNQVMLDGIREGIMSGAVTSDFVDLGYQSVEAAIIAARGERLPEYIYIDFIWYDQFNMDNPEIKALLYE